MTEIKTLGEAWQVLREHGLEGTYCPHCDQFAQARVLQKQDEIIKEMYEALKALIFQFAMAVEHPYSGDKKIYEQAEKALAKAKEE